MDGKEERRCGEVMSHEVMVMIDDRVVGVLTLMFERRELEWC